MIVNTVVAINALCFISLSLLAYIAWLRYIQKKDRADYQEIVRKLQLELRSKSDEIVDQNSVRTQTNSILHKEVTQPLSQIMSKLGHLETTIDELEHPDLKIETEFIHQELLELKGRMEHFADWNNSQKENNPVLMQEIKLYQFIEDVLEKEFLPSINNNMVLCYNHILQDLNVYTDSIALRASLLNVLKILQLHENNMQQIHINLAVCNDAFTIKINNQIVGPRLTRVEHIPDIKTSVDYIISKKLLEDVGGALQLNEDNEDMLIFSLQLPKM